MTIAAGVALGVLVLLAVLVGALVVVIVGGGDATLIASAATSGLAFLIGIVTATFLERRRR